MENLCGGVIWERFIGEANSSKRTAKSANYRANSVGGKKCRKVFELFCKREKWGGSGNISPSRSRLKGWEIGPDVVASEERRHVSISPDSKKKSIGIVGHRNSDRKGREKKFVAQEGRIEGGKQSASGE